mmetsp:Transcript_66630/g.77326  ORF Transcript_66630/g.77326 Transcript_66630/m.77326 type:complete len:266 (-) Transcript_66630:8-805(-)
MTSASLESTQERLLDDVLSNYQHVLDRVAKAASAAATPNRCPPRLVAVSKTKPVELLQHLYDKAQCRVFGENYVQELVEKAAVMPQQDIEWHFIGHLQSNKAQMLVKGCPSLQVVETVDSESVAKKLNQAVEQFRPDRRLCVFLQVNTSGEESKSGVEPHGDALRNLARFVLDTCPFLELKGLMTIGNPDYVCKASDFACLMSCRDILAAEMHVAAESLDLSMGMSSDFEAATIAGSTNVRVGSSIFGPRQRKITTPDQPSAAPS